jgi:ornithine carbamoyltransferase
MQDKSFKATTIVAPDVGNRLVLEAAFNNWAEETRPASILHVHYYHDIQAHVQGYQVVYEEPWMPYLAPETPREEEPAHMLI